MRLRMRPRLTGFAVTMAIMLAIMPPLAMTGSVSAAAQDDSSGLLDETAYESPQFGYTVTWDDTWSARQRDASSNTGGFDVITIRNGGGTLRVTGRADDDPAADVLQDTVALITRNADTSEIITETDGDVPSVEFTADRDHVIVEAHTLSDNDAVVIVTLTARESRFADALAAARSTVLLDDAPVFADPADASAATPAATEDATVEATPGVATVEAAATPASSPVATPATVEVAEPSATPDETADADVTEPATPDIGTPEDITEDPAADDAQGESIVDAAYTSPTYGFSVAWNDDVWETEDRVGEDGFNELELISATGSLYIWAGEFYDGDPAACLEGESDFYENDDPAVTDWVPAENADGEPITGETASAAYGVFTLTYTDQEEEDAESVDLVDYIECRELVPGEAVIVILATSTPDQYNDHVDDVLTITNQIQLQGEDDAGATPEASREASPESQTPEIDDPVTPEASPNATEEASPEAEVTEDASTGLDGATFTSPSFGFSLEIPSGWTVEDEVIADGEERLVVTNGISTVTLDAIDAYADDLEGCVDYAREQLEDDPAFADLELDETADGDPFEGNNSDRAYANFRYTGADDLEFAHFIECQYIVEGESVLIISQDVPYDQYAAERQARRQIEDAITLAS